MTTAQARRRLALIFDYEPSWFAESGSALAILLWAVCALCSPRFHLSGLAYVGPIVGIAFGPARLAVLFRLYPIQRVAAALLGLVWWSAIGCAMFRALGIVPALGVYVALALTDVFTIVKFSMWARRLPFKKAVA